MAQLTNKPRKNRIKITKKTPRDREGRAMSLQNPYRYINWTTLLLMPAIDHAAKVTGFSARSTLRYLQSRDE